jgi:DNA replication protein DnaC
MSDQNLFPECKTCVATPFCPAYAGKVTLQHKNWCSGNIRLNEALKLSEIPLRYHFANIHNFIKDTDNLEIHEELRLIVQDILTIVDKGTNFFLNGGKPGTGKTYVASCLLNHFLYKTCMKRFNFEHPLPLFVVFPDLVEMLRYQRDDEETQDRIDLIREVPFLLLDDIGAGTMTDFVREQTFRIINYRLNKKLSTIVTSNFSIKQLSTEDKLGPRIVSRLMDSAIGMELSGKDRRK